MAVLDDLGAECRVCGCTNDRACVRHAAVTHLVATGTVRADDCCTWDEPDLCSACTPEGESRPEWMHPDEWPTPRQKFGGTLAEDAA